MAVKTEFTKDNIIEILSDYQLGDFKNFQPIAEGAVQTNYILETTKDKFVFRYYENRSRNSVLFEVNLIKYLKDNKYPCSVPMKSNKGDFTGIHNNKPYVIFKFIEGEHIENPSEKQRNQLIKKVAQLHNITKDYTPLYKEHRWNYGVDFCVELAERESKRIDTPNSKEKFKWLKEELSNLQLPKSLPKGGCHCDFHFSNVLFKDGEFNGLIDFDDANYTYLLYDLICLVDPFISTFDWNTWDEFDIDDNVFDFKETRKVVSQYMKYRPLENIEKRHFFDVFKLSILIDCLWYFERGEVADFYEKRKIDYLETLGRERFYNKVFG